MPKWRSTAALAAIAVVTAACGSDDSETSTSEVPVTSASVDTSAAGAPGTTEIAPATSESVEFAGTIKIGANTELSGFDQIFGQSQVEAMELAIADINAAGGLTVQGEQYELALVARDNRSEATGVVQAAQELAAEGVLASSSPNSSFDAGYQIMKDAGILVFGGAPALALAILTAPSDNTALFSVIPFSPLLFPRWLPQLKSLFPELVRIGVLIEDEEVATPLVGSIRATAGELGMEVVAEERFPPGTTDFSTQLTRIKDASPDIVFTGRIPIHNIPAMQQAADLDVAPFLWAFTGIPSDLGDLDVFADETLVFSQFAPVVGEGVTIPALEEGAAKLDGAMSEESLPEIFIAVYNFIQLLAAGIEKAQTIDDAEAVAAAMKGLEYAGPFLPSRIDPMQFQDHPTSQIVYADGQTTVYLYESITNVEPSEQIVVE
jgi:branched-chain amino acid transport system substrate-binding protein